MYKSLPYECKAPLLNVTSSIKPYTNSSITKNKVETKINVNFYTTLESLKKDL